MYILMRHWLRIDNNLFRVNDTRFMIEFSKSNILRHDSERSCTYSEVTHAMILNEIPITDIDDSDVISRILPLVRECTYELKC